MGRGCLQVSAPCKLLWTVHTAGHTQYTVGSQRNSKVVRYLLRHKQVVSSWPPGGPCGSLSVGLFCHTLVERGVVLLACATKKNDAHLAIELAFFIGPSNVKQRMRAFGSGSAWKREPRREQGSSLSLALDTEVPPPNHPT